MKKLVIPAVIAAIMGMTACSGAPGADTEGAQTLKQYIDKKLAGAKTFEDTLAVFDGAYIGAFTALQAKRSLAGNDSTKYNVDEIIRGMSDALKIDTANVSYIYGLSMGIEALKLYQDMCSAGSVNKDAFVKSIASAMKLDSLSEQGVMELQPQFGQIMQELQKRAQAKKDAEIMGTKAAKENMMLGDAVAEKLKAHEGFKPVGKDGILCKVVKPGTDSLGANPATLVDVAYRIYTIDSNKTIVESEAKPMYVGRPANPVVASVLPYMTMGEEAEFFVPFKQAFGAAPQESLKVGPCQSVMIKLTVTANKQQQAAGVKK